jgi:DNA-binding transcriptional MocR family regulator
VQITPKQIAIAAQALNRHTAISDTARRVAQELLSATNKETGTAWPSEEGMAKALGLSDRTIRRAKAELRAHGLLTWFRRGTNKRGRTNVYMLAWDVLLSIGARIKATLKAARNAAMRRVCRPVTNDSKSRENAGRSTVDRTPGVLQYSPKFSFRNGLGEGKTRSKPQGQVLTDQQLDGRAQARIYDALKALGHAALSQFLSHPDAEKIEAEAIKAERYSPAQGRTGVATIAVRLHRACA